VLALNANNMLRKMQYPTISFFNMWLIFRIITENLQAMALMPTTSFLTATTLTYAIGAGNNVAAGTRLALQ